MHLRLLLPLLLALPLAAGAQVIRCTDPVSGKTTYTDQPCKNGALVVPPRTEEQQREDAANAALARERFARQQDEARHQEQERQRAEHAAQASQPRYPSDSAECRHARREAEFRSRSTTASEDEQRTARANAALACGQPAPAEILPAPVVVVAPGRAIGRYHAGDAWGAPLPPYGPPAAVPIPRPRPAPIPSGVGPSGKFQLGTGPATPQDDPRWPRGR